MKSSWQIRKCKLNGLDHPLGVDPDRALTFSWELEARKPGDRQTAYRVRLFESDGDTGSDVPVWDSGIVNTSVQHATCGSVTIRSGTRYTWSLSVWNTKEEAAEAEAAFHTGLRQDDWNGRWIWKPGDVTINDYAIFRKRFLIGNNTKRAIIYTSAHHYVKLFINGICVTGYGTPAPSNPPATKYYVCHDVTSLLTEGENTIGAVVHYLGGGATNNVDGLPGFICQLHRTAVDGSQHIVASDETWELCTENPYKLGMPHHQNRRMTAVEQYDGAIAETVFEWLSGDDADMEISSNAAESPIENAEAVWRLKPQEIPEGQEECSLRPQACGVQRIGWQVFDAGHILSGWVRIRLKGHKGVLLRVRYSERLADNGTVDHNVCNEKNSEYYYDEYRMYGGVEEIWQTDFAYKAFRYFEITDYPEWIREEDVEVVYAHTPLGDAGSFECSVPLLNAMFSACMVTQKNNVMGLVVDCPHREQAQYLADSDLQAEVLTGYFEAQHVLRKVLLDFKDALQPDGSFPFVSPCSFDRKEFHVIIPEWDLHFVSLLWRVYFTYDDMDIVKQCYETAARMIEAALVRISPETGLVPKWDRWHISDWPYPTIDNSGPYLTVYNLKFYRALTMMAQLAKLLGLDDEASNYERASSELCVGMVKHLYDKKKRKWRDSYGSAKCSQGTNALAIRCGVDPEPDRRMKVKQLTKKWETRTVLSLELFRLLFEEGQEETAFEWLARPEYPGWGYMIAQGSKTMWEGFEDKESHSHAWNGYPARLMADYILGVRALEPGFKRIAIRPYYAPKLTYAQGTIKTVLGDVRVRWDRRGSQISLFIQLPVGVTADVDTSGEGTISVELGSGNHLLTVDLEQTPVTANDKKSG